MQLCILILCSKCVVLYLSVPFHITQNKYTDETGMKNEQNNKRHQICFSIPAEDPLGNIKSCFEWKKHDMHRLCMSDIY